MVFLVPHYYGPQIIYGPYYTLTTDYKLASVSHSLLKMESNRVRHGDGVTTNNPNKRRVRIYHKNFVSNILMFLRKKLQYIYIYIYIYIYMGIAHIVHEACSYSAASSVMEHVLAVHSVIW